MNLVQFLTSKRKGRESGTTTIRRVIKEGAVFTVSGNSNSHDYGAVGSKIPIRKDISIANTFNGWIDGQSTMAAAVPGRNAIIRLQDISVTPLQTEVGLKSEIKRLKEEKNDIQKSIREIEIKIKFMSENDLDEFDENHFKAYSVLQTLKETKSDIEKAKIIAEIIK